MVAATDQQPDEVTALRQQREALHRELVRKTYRIGELEEELAEACKINKPEGASRCEH